jgi:predicted O-methyltransferase YrrM
MLTRMHACSQVLKELRDETAAMNGSHMQITADQGQFLSLLVKLIGATKAVEVGVFTGYSSVAIAMVSMNQRQ